MKKYALMLIVAVLTGCARQPLPVYPEMAANDSYQVIVERAQAIQSVQSTADLTMRSVEKSISLDAAILIQRPENLRVRAWKFGQAVFDLTVNHDGAWQYIPREEAREGTQITRDIISRFIEVLLPSSASATPRIEGESLIIDTPNTSGLERLRYDRATLVLRSFQVLDSAQKVRFELSLDDYRLIDSHPWPMSLRAISQQGTIQVRFTDVTINPVLPASTFKPPSRAERLP